MLGLRSKRLCISCTTKISPEGPNEQQTLLNPEFLDTYGLSVRTLDDSILEQELTNESCFVALRTPQPSEPNEWIRKALQRILEVTCSKCLQGEGDCVQENCKQPTL